jgi:hypothetical protein
MFEIDIKLINAKLNILTTKKHNLIHTIKCPVGIKYINLIKTASIRT